MFSSLGYDVCKETFCKSLELVKFLRKVKETSSFIHFEENWNFIRFLCQIPVEQFSMKLGELSRSTFYKSRRNVNSFSPFINNVPEEDYRNNRSVKFRSFV